MLQRSQVFGLGLSLAITGAMPATALAQDAGAGAQPALAETIRVGVSAGPHAEVLDVVAKEAAKAGLTLEVIEFTDYVLPNAALAAGEIEANSFQHQPYLDKQIEDRGYDLVSVGQTLVFPLGFYSKTVTSFEALADGATIAIQNDPTNGGRSLLLLQAKGYLRLREGTGLTPSIGDVIENPRGFTFLELDAAQLARALDDVDAASVNTNYAVEAGLDPVKDAILREAADSPYANVIAVRRADAGAPWVEVLVAAYRSQPVKDFVLSRFGGAVVVTW
mgnify:CR=1 FL=1